MRLADPVFIVSCCTLSSSSPPPRYPQLTFPVLVIANHFLWFKHFSHPSLPLDHPYSSAYQAGGLKGSPYDYSTADPYLAERFPTFAEISAFFGICVWMVPFSLFVSLSASDNVLPSTAEFGGVSSSGGGGGIGIGVGLGDAGGRRTRGQGMAKMVVSSVKEYFGTSAEALGFSEARRHERFE